MKDILAKTDKKILKVIRTIGLEADAQGLKAFVVGGFVRDLFLKRSNADIDMVVEGDAVAFAQKLSRKKKLAVKEHKRFGTAAVYGWSDLHIDFVSARSESYPYSGSLPIVKRAGLKDDLYRRDFTINALALCINKKNFGHLVDVCDGLVDLKKRMIRIFHDESFIDDPTRILRAVRFEQRFGFRLSVRTGKFLKKAIEKRVYRTVSAPRYFQEFARGLNEDRPAKYLRRLKALEVLDFLKLSSIPARAILDRVDRQISSWRKEPLWNVIDQRTLYLSVLFSGMSEEKILEKGSAFQWPRLEKKKVVMAVAALKEFKLLQKKGLRSSELEDFIRFSSDEIIFFIRAMTSDKILTVYLDKELRIRNSNIGT